MGKIRNYKKAWRHIPDGVSHVLPNEGQHVSTSPPCFLKIESHRFIHLYNIQFLYQVKKRSISEMPICFYSIQLFYFLFNRFKKPRSFMISYGVAFTSFAASSDLTNSDFVRRASISLVIYLHQKCRRKIYHGWIHIGRKNILRLRKRRSESFIDEFM